MISFQNFFMFCYLDQYLISEDETGKKIGTRKTAEPEVLASSKSFPGNIP